MKCKNKIGLVSLLAVASLFGCKNEKQKDDFEYLGQIAPFLHKVRYDDYEFDVNRLTVEDVFPSCSVVRNGNYIGRKL